MNAIFGAKCFNLVSATWHYADVGYIADAFKMPTLFIFKVRGLQDDTCRYLYYKSSVESSKIDRPL
jgi:hypothetical protein